MIHFRTLYSVLNFQFSQMSRSIEFAYLRDRAHRDSDEEEDMRKREACKARHIGNSRVSCNMHDYWRRGYEGGPMKWD